MEGSGVRVVWDDETQSHFHAVWLRDNCGCRECRDIQSGERLLYTADIPDGLSATQSHVSDTGQLSVTWSDGHSSLFDRVWLAVHDYSSDARIPPAARIVLWEHGAQLPRFEHDALLSSDGTLLEYLDALHAHGAAIVNAAPAVPGEVVRFAERIGIVRTVAFGTVHDVRNDPSGYNVAHTALELKPHSDLASYCWPPSCQLLHYITNEVTGGETVLVDGWNVVAELKREYPEDYELLSSLSVPFKIYSATDDTYAEEPIIQRHPDGRVRIFRFSNQTMQPIRIDADLVEPFYESYRNLGRLISSDRFRVTVKLDGGDLLAVHNHRVLHGRLAFDPSSGNRHLQDLYMEWDDVMAKRRVLRGHLPLGAWPAE